jgi:ribosomal protein L16 Arg81 hydroxylase
MDCRFLDTFTLKSLLWPVTEEAFRSYHWERTPLVVHRGERDYYGNLFTLEDVDQAIATAPAKIVTADAKSTQYVRYEEKSGSIPLDRVLAEMRDGRTLLLEHLHRRNQKLGLLCRLLEQELGHRFETNIYLTPPHGQGLIPHWDNHDTIILQVAGSKHWRIEQQRRKLPTQHERMTDPNREFTENASPFILEQGDMIYIPRGFVHAAECGAQPSLHITVGVRIYTWEELLKAVISGAALEDESLRHALPLGFLQAGDGLAQGVMGALHKIADEKLIPSLVDRFKDEVVTKATLDISGQVTAIFQSDRLGDEDRMGPRPGIVYRLHALDGTVRLHFGAKSITFPDRFREALGFALNTADYAVSDIGSELGDGEKIAFIERLMQEGLVVRKAK